jgi:hypothetical protein
MFLSPLDGVQKTELLEPQYVVGYVLLSKMLQNHHLRDANRFISTFQGGLLLLRTILEVHGFSIAELSKLKRHITRVP